MPSLGFLLDLDDTLVDDRAATSAAFGAFLAHHGLSCAPADTALLSRWPAFLARTPSVPKVIVTNGERSQQLRKLAATGITAHFVAVVTPGDCGFPKPHPEIFRAAVRLVGVPVEHCVMIGDDPLRDIEPARALGMRAHRVEHGNPAASILAALDGG